MRNFTHLSMTDRLKIEKMHRNGKSVREIADAIHVHNSTIYRELKRGACIQRTTDLIDREIYCADVAEQRYRDNLAAKGPELKIGSDLELAQYIEEKIINDDYSPAAVLGEIKAKGIVFSVTISEWTLYSYITKGVFLRLTNKNLPVKRNKKKQEYKQVRPARAPRGESIENRPEHINEREEFGHWEMDTVISAKNKKRTLLVLTERMTRREIIVPIAANTTVNVVAVLDRLEKRYGRELFAKLFKSVTVDNGSEFADCEGMERTYAGEYKRTKIYYCHPYSSYERGSNENQNKMIRRKLPKGTDFTRVTNKTVQKIEDWINHYPREMFGFRCSEDLFQERLLCME